MQDDARDPAPTSRTHCSANFSDQPITPHFHTLSRKRFDIDTCPLQLGVKCVAALHLSEILCLKVQWMLGVHLQVYSPKQSCCGQRFHRVAQDLQVVCGMDDLDT